MNTMTAIQACSAAEMKMQAATMSNSCGTMLNSTASTQRFIVTLLPWGHSFAFLKAHRSQIMKIWSKVPVHNSMHNLSICLQA